MFEETTPEKPEEKDPIEALSGILEKFENRPLLKKIEKNTAVLPALLKALTVTRGTRAAHVYVRDLSKIEKPLRQATERLRTSEGAIAVRPSSVATRIAQAATIRSASQGATVAPAVVPASLTPAAASAAETLRRKAPSRPALPPDPDAPRPSTPRQRAANGRFGPGQQSAGQREREAQRNEEPAKGLKGWFKAAIGSVLGKGKDKGGDVQDAAGKAIGGPIWEAAKEMQGAAGELKEKLQDDKTLLGKSFKWLGKKTGIVKGPGAPPTEGAEQRRHRELVQAIEKSDGGGEGGGGIADAIGGGAAGLAGGKLLSKIPGAGIAAKVLAKVGPMMSVLAAGATVAAVGAITVAASGFAGLMGIISKGRENGWGRPLSPEQRKALAPYTPPTAEEKSRWNNPKLRQDLAPVINSSSRKNGLDPNLTTAVISQESQFNPNARSKAGAEGLMQLMPRTARALGVNPQDPKANIKGGTAHLGRLMKKYNGNETVALQAYNWGEGNMDAYLKTGKGAKGQSMPVETRKYPVSVQRNKTVAEKAAVPVKSQVKEVVQPKPMSSLAPAPVTAQLMGTEKLIAALGKQNAPKKETSTLAPIKAHYDDTLINLIAHDRI